MSSADRARHYLKLRYREKVVELIFVAELLRHLWANGLDGVEILTPRLASVPLHPVSLRRRGALANLPIGEIERHFRHFLSPSNLFLVPKAIGELVHVCTTMKGRA